MLIGPEQAGIRLALFVAVAVAGVVGARLLSRRVGWAPAGPLAVIAATPLVPSLPVAFGISTDDVLPAVGAVLLLLCVDWRRGAAVGWPRLVVAGAALMTLAGAIASLANASAPSDVLVMGLKSVGHLAFLALIGRTVALSLPSETRRRLVAIAVAAIATAEAVFGLVAWLVPLPWNAGLEPTRGMTSLLARVPGRVAGTIGLSPNFLGAVFVLSLPLTVALALRATDRRVRMAWWLAAGAQLLALALTFTRTSLVIAVALLVVLLLVRGHARLLAPVAGIVLMAAIATPLGGRLLGDANDRAALYTSAIRMMVDHPLTGVGPGRTLVVAEADPVRYRTTQFGQATNNAHNTILLAGAETGVVGALGALLVNVGLAWSALAAFVAGVRRPERLSDASATQASPDGDPLSQPAADADLVAAAALGVLGFLLQGMTNNLFAVQVTSVMATLVVAAYVVPAPALLHALRRGLDAPIRRRSAGPA
jgi:O-antigen ligase